MGGRVDHLVVGSADLEVGMRWVEDRLGVAPVLGGVHDGFGTRNAVLGLGYLYLEVLSLDPEQGDVSIPWSERVRAMASPALLTAAGAVGENWILPGGYERLAKRLPDKCTLQLHAGDILRMRTPGGGGWSSVADPRGPGFAT